MDNNVQTNPEVTEDALEEIRKKVRYFYNKIECFIENKQLLIEQYEQVSVEDILRNSPKHFPMIQMIEQIYIFVSKDKNWLQHFLEQHRIDFDWQIYKLWKSGKEYFKRKYDNTQCPSKWITEILGQFIELLKALQILLYIEFYTFDCDFKSFLKKNSVIDYKMKANFISKSLPSENLDKIFEVIDFLFKISIESAVHTQYIIETRACMEAYRFIDSSEIFTLLKKKEFYIRYRLEYLRLTPKINRLEVPAEDDIISVGEDFIKNYKGLLFTYNDYKNKLIEKYSSVKSGIFK